MKTNRSRRSRFAFDAVADAYDRSRPVFDQVIVDAFMVHAGLSRDDRALEIGAGTGQLTRGLVRAGLKVEALEPGVRLAARLRSSIPAGDRLTISPVPFEDYPTGERFDAVFAANSFHWLDPSVSYRKVHDLLRPGRALCTLWNFPIATNASLQHRLNSIAFVGSLEQFQRDPISYGDEVDRILREGRAELAESGLFSDPWWKVETRTARLRRDDYVLLLTSYANGAIVVDEIDANVGRVLGPGDVVEITDYIGLCVAPTRP